MWLKVGVGVSCKSDALRAGNLRLCASSFEAAHNFILWQSLVRVTSNTRRGSGVLGRYFVAHLSLAHLYGRYAAETSRGSTFGSDFPCSLFVLEGSFAQVVMLPWQGSCMTHKDYHWHGDAKAPFATWKLQGLSPNCHGLRPTI